MQRKIKQKKNTLPPYRLPNWPNATQDVLDQVNPWALLEFFKVEALLRAPKIQRHFKQSKKKPKNILSFFFEYPNRKWGKEIPHHKLLDPHFFPKEPPRPWRFIDDDEIKKSRVNLLPDDLKEAYLFHESQREKIQPTISLRLDLRYPPGTILKALEPFLKIFHEGWKEQIRKNEMWFIRARKPPIKISYDGPWMYQGILPSHPDASKRKSPITVKNFHRWIDCLRCYDLRVQGWTFPKIAETLWGKSEAEGRIAQKAFDAAKKLIAQAEVNQWPPKLAKHKITSS